MKIACLGWGSLIWRPDTLLIQRQWFINGPILPVEFLRQSKDGRLTLVLSKDVRPVRVLWAMLATDDLDIAVRSLGTRENIPAKNFSTSIGSISVEEETRDEMRMEIQRWGKCIGLDAVIWTNLGPKFNGENNVAPTMKQASEYLASLDANTLALAEEYIRRAPKQIDTDFRREFERIFGWTSIV
jgi:hypothetical protein